MRTVAWLSPTRLTRSNMRRMAGDAPTMPIKHVSLSGRRAVRRPRATRWSTRRNSSTPSGLTRYAAAPARTTAGSASSEP
jgi:hypothetical protein